MENEINFSNDGMLFARSILHLIWFVTLILCFDAAFEASIIEVDKSGLELFLYKLMKHMNAYFV